MSGLAVGEVTLGALLDDAKLGLESIVTSRDARARVVEGVHSIEIPQPGRWLHDGWVMLTTGLALPRSPMEQCELIRDLDDRGVVALGFGVGCSYDDVPPALVEEARRRGFPLFSVPLETPFVDIVAAVQHHPGGSEAQAFARLTAMQRYLMDALSDAEAESCIVARLAELVDAEVALVDQTGNVITGETRLRPETVRAATESTPQHPQRVDDDGFVGWMLPVGGREDGRRWLVAGVPAPRSEHRLLKAGAQLVVPLLETTARLARAQADHDRALRRATLAVLLDATTTQDAALASARAQAYDVEVAAGVRIAVVATRAIADVEPDALLDAVETQVRAHGFSWLACLRDDAVVVLFAADVADEVARDILLDVHPHALIGIGRTVHRANAVSTSQLDAALVVRQLSRRGAARAASYDDLDLGSALIGEIEPGRIRSKVDRWLTPVLDNPMAYETLVAYLEHDLDVARTSRALNLHPNSARYRLARVEELLGAPLRRPSTIAALHFALLSQRYTGDEPATDADAPAVRAA